MELTEQVPEELKGALEVTEELSKVFTKLHQVLKNTPEKAQILNKLTETGMWLRMYIDLERAEAASKPEIKIRKKNEEERRLRQLEENKPN